MITRPVPGPLMRDLRRAALSSRRYGSRRATQERAAALLVASARNLYEWEKHGSTVAHAYAYVGLAYRLGGQDRAARVLQLLAQLEGVEGVAVQQAERED